MTRNRFKKQQKIEVKAAQRPGITIGGPVPGQHFQIKPGQRHYFFPTPQNPTYLGAYYTLINSVTPLGEQKAVFQINKER